MVLQDFPLGPQHMEVAAAVLLTMFVLLCVVAGKEQGAQSRKTMKIEASATGKNN